MLKNQKGITLVALVITIIVLLILAGVSISLVIGNNGIIGRAQGATTESVDAEFRQALELAGITTRLDYSSGNVTNLTTAYSNTVDSANKTGFAYHLDELGYSVDKAITSTAAEVVVTKKSDTKVTRKFNLSYTTYGDLTVSGPVAQ